MDLPDLNTLCLSCGACCDGVLFTYFELSEDEPRPARSVLRQLRPTSTDCRKFAQPCTALDHGKCTIYSARPNICRSYKCQTLIGAEEGRITLAEARERIEQMQCAKSDVVALIGIGGASAANRSQNLARAGAYGSPQDTARIQLAIGVLEVLLDKHFRTNKQRKFAPDVSVPTLPMGGT